MPKSCAYVTVARIKLLDQRGLTSEVQSYQPMLRFTRMHHAGDVIEEMFAWTNGLDGRPGFIRSTRPDHELESRRQSERKRLQQRAKTQSRSVWESAQARAKRGQGTTRRTS
jgi:hypothetical protein